MRRWTAWSTVAATFLGFAREASAQQAAEPGLPIATLDYQVAAGLTCPTAEELRAELLKELHYDAFDTTVPGVPVGRFHIIVSRKRPGVLVVQLSFDDTSGKLDFETAFDGAPAVARTCSHLVKKHVVSEIVMELTLKLNAMFQEVLTAGPAGAVGPKASRYSPHRRPGRWPWRLLSAPRRGGRGGARRRRRAGRP